MHNLCVDLDIPIWPVKNHVPLNTMNDYWNRLPHDWINPEIVRFLESLGLTFRIIDYFYLKPYQSGVIHIDSHDQERTSISKLNWSTSLDHKMNFYGYKDKVVTKKWQRIDHDIPAYTTSFNSKDLNLLESYVIKKPTLLDGNVPHNVVNGSEERHCFSIALRYKGRNNDMFLPFEEAINYFSSYIVRSNTNSYS